MAPRIRNRCRRSTLGRNSGTHCIGDWVDLRAGLDFWRRKTSLSPTGSRTPQCPCCKPLTTVHWLRVEVKFHQYRGGDKSLARPERKQATATEDFEFHISYL
jgi:hypothetical protein